MSVVIMKKTALAVALCALMVTTTTYANQPGAYAGVSIGKMTGDADIVEFKDTTVKAFVGYQINKMVAVEGHYAKMDDTQRGINVDLSTVGV